MPDRFVLGHDATGELCVAARNWRDARVGDVFDRAWSITCRGVAASRPQGYVLGVADDKRAAVPPSCGAPVEQALAGIGKVVVRRHSTLGYLSPMDFERQARVA